MAARTRLMPEARRAQIVGIAAQLFAENGYAATSVREIREAAGIAQGTFYWHFPSKESLADAIVELSADASVDAIGQVLADPGIGAIERFVRVRDAAFARFDAEAGALEVFHRPDNAEMHDRIAQAARARLVPLLAAFVRDGVVEGVFTASDPEAAALFVARAAETVDTSLLLGDPGSGPRYAEALTEFVLRGLGYTGELPCYEGGRS